MQKIMQYEALVHYSVYWKLRWRNDVIFITLGSFWSRCLSIRSTDMIHESGLPYEVLFLVPNIIRWHSNRSPVRRSLIWPLWQSRDTAALYSSKLYRERKSLSGISWGLVYQKQVWKAWTSNYILQYLRDMITYPCPWYKSWIPRSKITSRFISPTKLCYFGKVPGQKYTSSW